MADKFSAMLGTSTRPFEDYAVGIIGAILQSSKESGYSVTTRTHDPVSIADALDNVALIEFTFSKPSLKKAINASIQIYNDLSGKKGVRAAQGFPPELGTLLLNLSSSTPGQENSKGVQAVRQDDSPAQAGRGQVEVKPDTSSTSSQLTQALVSSLDLATTLGFLKKNERTRQYIGASSIGESCMAYHALSLRGFPSDTPEPKLIRIFDQGHRIEEMVVEELKAAGHTVEPVDPVSGLQWAYSSHGGHHVCHLDGFITLAGCTERMTLEIKSMNDAMFKKFKEKGVEISHPHYVTQIMDGLMLARADGVEVSKGMLVAYCKNNSQYHAEIIDYDDMAAASIESKVTQAVTLPLAMREGGSSYEYKCKGCFKKTSCWDPNLPGVSCVQCMYSSPSASGSNKQWTCRKTDKPVPDAICEHFCLWKPVPAPRSK